MYIPSSFSKMINWSHLGCQLWPIKVLYYEGLAISALGMGGLSHNTWITFRATLASGQTCIPLILEIQSKWGKPHKNLSVPCDWSRTYVGQPSSDCTLRSHNWIEFGWLIQNASNKYHHIGIVQPKSSTQQVSRRFSTNKRYRYSIHRRGIGGS